MTVKRITAEVVNRLRPGERVSDDKLAGFRVRRQTTTSRVYEFNYSINGVRKQIKIGRHGTVTPDGITSWTPETARREAKRLAGLVAQGIDPKADRRGNGAPTVKDLFDRSWSTTSSGCAKTAPRASTKGYSRNTCPPRSGTARWPTSRGPTSKSCRANCTASRRRPTCVWPCCRRCWKNRRHGGGVRNTQIRVGTSNATKPTTASAC